MNLANEAGRSFTPAGATCAATVPARGMEPLREEAQRPALSGDGDPGPQGNANASFRPAPVAGRSLADPRLHKVDRPLLRRRRQSQKATRCRPILWRKRTVRRLVSAAIGR